MDTQVFDVWNGTALGLKVNGSFFTWHKRVRSPRTKSSVFSSLSLFLFIILLRPQHCKFSLLFFFCGRHFLYYYIIRGSTCTKKPRLVKNVKKTLISTQNSAISSRKRKRNLKKLQNKNNAARTLLATEPVEEDENNSCTTSTMKHVAWCEQCPRKEYYKFTQYGGA